MNNTMPSSNSLYTQVSELIQEARKQVASQVNTALLATYWNVGRLILRMNRIASIEPNMASRC